MHICLNNNEVNTEMSEPTCFQDLGHAFVPLIMFKSGSCEPGSLHTIHHNALYASQLKRDSKVLRDALFNEMNLRKLSVHLILMECPLIIKKKKINNC